MGLKAGTAAHGCLERGRKGYPVLRRPALRGIALAILLCTPLLASDCLAIREAAQHVSESKCTTG
jgi:hypothetical protein